MAFQGLMRRKEIGLRMRENRALDKFLARSMPYQTRWEKEGFFAEFSGVVPSWEIEAVNAEFTGDPRFDTARFAIWDMLRVERLVVAESDVEKAAATDKGASMIRRSLHGAIVVPEGQVRKMVELYLTISGELDNTWDTRLFGGIESAWRWLGIK